MKTSPPIFWIIRFSSLGDIVVTTATLSWINTHFPNAKIYYITASEYRDLFLADPRITEVIPFERQHDTLLSFIHFLRHALFPRMRAEGGVILDFHNTLRAKLLKFLAPLPTPLTLQKHTLKRLWFCLTKINLLKHTPPLAQRLCNQLAQTFHITSPVPSWRPQLHAPTQVRTSFAPELNRDQSYVAMVPVARWPGKCWPVEHFADLIHAIHQKTSYRCLILGAPQDRVARELAERTDALSLVGRLSLSETLCLLKQFCKMVIANDTGLMHMADALDIPTCAILGPTHPSFGYPPLGPQSFVVDQPLWCRPCSRSGQAPCIRWGKRPCLTTLSPQLVFAACVHHWRWVCSN